MIWVRRTNTRGTACRIGLLVLALALGPVAANAATGWHGETMPPGLERGEKQGEYLWPKDGSIMVYVPPGPFLMGSTEGPYDEQPQREVTLDGFYIDKHEASWGQWKKSGLPYAKTPGERKGLPEPPDWGIVDEQPVNSVTWRDAQAYVAWAGKRLPTEAEWEKAARGTDGRTYPWGNEPPNIDRAIWKGHPQALISTAPVDWFPAGASPYGVLNMAGNVYEWCQDVYDRAFYRSAPANNPLHEHTGEPNVLTNRVLRGGGFVFEISELGSAVRYRLHEVDKGPYIGFRAALSGVPNQP